MGSFPRLEFDAVILSLGPLAAIVRREGSQVHLQDFAQVVRRKNVLIGCRNVN